MFLENGVNEGVAWWPLNTAQAAAERFAHKHSFFDRRPTAELPTRGDVDELMNFCTARDGLPFSSFGLSDLRISYDELISVFDHRQHSSPHEEFMNLAPVEPLQFCDCLSCVL